MNQAARGLCLAAVLLPRVPAEALASQLRTECLSPAETPWPWVERLEQLGANPELLATLRAVTELDPARYYEALLGFELVPFATVPKSSLPPNPPAKSSGAAVHGFEVQPSTSRRQGGSHYSPERLARELTQRCLAPLLAEITESHAVLDLRICDMAVGAGVFLLAAQQVLTERLLQLRQQEGLSTQAEEARQQVTTHCLLGCDLDPLALWLARRALTSSLPALPHLSLLHGNALLSSQPGVLTPPLGTPGVAWHELRSVFERKNPGFDAIVGNPPWVAYVGRAAQPLPKALSVYFEQQYRGFRQYRTLHGLFVERGAQLLRQGGRLGLLLPTSVADLAGYKPARDAHDALCVVDSELPDFGDAFEGVFQPCLGLLSTRRERTIETTPTLWPLERPDLNAAQRTLLDRLGQLPRCPANLFGERGLQTNTQDREQLRACAEGQLDPALQVLYTGTEVLEFQRLPPRLAVDPKQLSQTFRAAEEWQGVALWVRQTARYPIVAESDEAAFRNSIIAVFETVQYPRQALLAYLNSTPVRWFHFHRQRDARQGMPQVKVAHLRELPAPPSAGTPLGDALQAWGQRLAARNRGITADERRELDALVGQALLLSEAELALVVSWGQAHPPPLSRTRGVERVLKPEPALPS